MPSVGGPSVLPANATWPPVPGAAPTIGDAGRSAFDRLQVAPTNTLPPAAGDLGMVRVAGVVALAAVVAAGLRARARRHSPAREPATQRRQAVHAAQARPPSPQTHKRTYFYQLEAAALRAQGKSFTDFARDFYDFEDGPDDGRFVYHPSASLCRKLHALGDGFLELVVDPGLMSRIDDFVAFLHRFPQQERAARSPWQLRNMFSEHLGTTVVWRLLALTPDELQQIRRDGLFAHGLVGERDGDFRPRWAAKSATLMIHMYQTLYNDVDELMPVTSMPAAISPLGVLQGARDGKDIYVLTLRVPRLDLLAPRRCKGSLAQPSVLRCDRDGYMNFFPAAVEQFLPFYAAPCEIIAVRKTPRWAYFLQGVVNAPRLALSICRDEARLLF